MRSDQINEIATALSKAQGQMKPAKKSGFNPHFKSKYSTMQDLIDAAKEPLKNNGLSITQLTSETDGGVLIETYLMHTSGQWLQGEMKLMPQREGPQALGSALTYARRYCYESILGLDGELDDDGEAAQKPKAQATNGNKKHTSGDFKNWINNQLPDGKKYSHVAHLRNSIRKEIDDEEWDFPPPTDAEGWKQTVIYGRAIVERKTADQTPTQDALIETEEAQPHAPDVED